MSIRGEVSRRTLIVSGSAAAVGVMLACGGYAAVVGSEVEGRSGPRDVPDGAGLGDVAWNALPVGVRQLMYQASELHRAVRGGELMSWPNLAPEPVVLIERDSGTGPLLRAYVVFSRVVPASEHADVVEGPPEWGLGPVSVIIDEADLAELRTGLGYDQQEFGNVTFRDAQWWSVMVRSAGALPEPPQPFAYGFDGGTWYASAVWFHEYVHGLQPREWPLPAGWDLWSARWAYPAGDVAFAGLQHLENAVVATAFTSPAAARAGLETFLAVREQRRAMFPDQVTSYECMETVEGVASYAEGAFLAFAGREAVSPDSGKVYSFPQRVPTDLTKPDWYFWFFWGEFEYSTGCALAQALTVLVGSAWKEDYCAHAGADISPTLVEYVRQYVPTPTGEHAEALVAAAAEQHDLVAMEAAVREADFVTQWRNSGYQEPTTITQDETDPLFGVAVTNAKGEPFPFARLLLEPDPSTTIGGTATVLIADANGVVSAGGVFEVKPGLGAGRHVVGSVRALDFRNPGIDLVHTNH